MAFVLVSESLYKKLGSWLWLYNSRQKVNPVTVCCAGTRPNVGMMANTHVDDSIRLYGQLVGHTGYSASSEGGNKYYFCEEEIRLAIKKGFDEDSQEIADWWVQSND